MTSQQQLKQWANAVKKHRKRHGLSQEKLAQLADVSLSYVQKIENAVKGSAKIVSALLEAKPQRKTA